jgi:hypothetical protein
MALSAPSKAQTNTYDLDLFGTLGEPGAFHVKLQKWDGTVDGPGKTFRITQVIKQAGVVPIGQGVEVDISFYGQLASAGPTMQIAGISGDAGVTTITSSIPANPQTHNWTIAMYNGVGTKFGSFTSPTGITPDVIRKTATNQFLENSTGRITTASLAASAMVSVITDNGHIYSGSIDLSTTAVPEASSMALLLPGLIPLGLVMRRRARSRASAS